MSNRTVAVVLKAQVDNYLQNMDAARRHTTDVEKAARSATEQLRVHQEALTRLGVGMTAVGAAAAVGLGVAIKASAEFGSKMAQIQSLSHATAAQMQQVSDAAMSQGKAFGYSASQVADAQIELQKAGIGIQEQLGGALKGALTLAAAGQIDVADATSIAVQAMTQFGLAAKDVPHIADQIASAADSSVGSVDSIGQSLNQAGLVANQFGWSLEETVGTLTAFSQAGLNGSDGGTSLKTALLALATPTKQQSEAMKTLGIDVFDASGHFVSAAGLADQLQKGLGKVDDESRLAALGIIFGSDAARSAGVAYSQGAAGIQKYIDGNDRAGFASAQAAGKLNSLEGDAKKLAAAFETDLIRAGGSVDGALRSIVQSATGLVDVFGSIPQPVLAVGVGLTAVVAGVGLVGGAALIAVPKITAFRASLDELGISGKKTAAVVGKGGALLTGIALFAAGLAGAGTQGIASAQQVAQAGEMIEAGWKGANDAFQNYAATTSTDMKGSLSNALKNEMNGAAGFSKFVDTLTLGLTSFSAAFKTNEGTFDAMGQQLAGLAQQDYGRAAASFADLVEKYHLGADETKQLLTQMPAYRDELIQQAKSAKVSASDHNLLLLAQGKGAVSAKVLAAQQEAAARSADKQAAQIAALAGEAQSADVDIQKLSDTISGFGSATLDARAAQRDFRQAVKDARAAIADGSKTDDEKQAALDGIARAGIASAASLAKLPDGAEKARKAMKNAREDFIEVAAKMLGSRTAAKKLADQLGLIPENVPVAVNVSGTGKAQDQIADLKRALQDINGFRATVEVAARVAGAPNAAQVARNAADNLQRRAGGGPINGPGPKGVDSVYAILAPGEHVLTAREVDRMGGQSAVSAFRADLMGQVQAYAKGGPVGAIDQQKAAAEKAQRDADDYQRKVIAQKKKAEAASKAAEQAQNRYEDIDGTKKNRDAKKAAKDAAERAKKTADAEQQRVDDLREKRDKARDTAKDATESAAQLRLDREDFVSAERRDPDRVLTDPLSYVDQLRSMSRDDNYSAADRQKFKDSANDYERSLARMTEESKKAADNLSTLQDSAKQLHDSVAQAVTGGYSLAGASASTTTETDSGWFQRDGIMYRSTGTMTSGPTAASIARSYSIAATHSGEFADALQALAGKGLNTTLLAELAQMGTEEGLPIARAILAGSDADRAEINRSFSALGAQGDRAGSIVSGATYAQQIDAANTQLASINAQLKSDGEKLRRLIASAFGLPGYALGTSAATEGLHWVGEHGPEIVGLRAGQPVATAAESARWVRGGMSTQAPTQVTVAAPEIRFPSTLLLQDAHGFEAQFRVVAQQMIEQDAAQDAVLMIGTGNL